MTFISKVREADRELLEQVVEQLEPLVTTYVLQGHQVLAYSTKSGGLTLYFEDQHGRYDVGVNPHSYHLSCPFHNVFYRDLTLDELKTKLSLYLFSG